jgi:hypothetical protein
MTYRLLQESNKVIPVLLLLETNKVHTGSRDVLCKIANASAGDDTQKLSASATNLFGVFKVIEKSVFSPYNALLHIGRRIRETFYGTSLTTEKTGRRSARVEGGNECSYPCKLGPTLLGSPAPTVWHKAQLLLKIAAPLPASP